MSPEKMGSTMKLSVEQKAKVFNIVKWVKIKAFRFYFLSSNEIISIIIIIIQNCSAPVVSGASMLSSPL